MGKRHQLLARMQTFRTASSQTVLPRYQSARHGIESLVWGRHESTMLETMKATGVWAGIRRRFDLIRSRSSVGGWRRTRSLDEPTWAAEHQRLSETCLAGIPRPNQLLLMQSLERRKATPEPPHYTPLSLPNRQVLPRKFRTLQLSHGRHRNPSMVRLKGRQVWPSRLLRRLAGAPARLLLKQPKRLPNLNYSRPR